MIKALERFDQMTAAGLLARTALSLSYVDSSSMSVVNDEKTVRASIIEEARSRLGIASDDESMEAKERIAELLDAESDELISPSHPESALARLAERGDLPSDLYEIDMSPALEEFLGKRFSLEKQIIETTIRAPSREQHYGPARKPGLQPSMISLFARSFRTRWPQFCDARCWPT
jgi:hypothetical protein